MESVLFSPLYYHLPDRAQRFLTDTFCFHTYVRTFQSNNFQDANSKQLPKSLKNTIYQRCIQLQKQRSGRLTDSQKIERLVNEVQVMKNMLKNLLSHPTLPFHSAGTEFNDIGEKVDRHKFSMSSLTHQLSMEEGCVPCTDEPDEDFTKLIEKNRFEAGVFSSTPSRKASKMSHSGLTYIQEEEGSIERPDSTDFESYSGDSNI